jgi:hypothetical protein
MGLGLIYCAAGSLDSVIMMPFMLVKVIDPPKMETERNNDGSEPYVSNTVIVSIDSRVRVLFESDSLVRAHTSSHQRQRSCMVAYPRVVL